MCLIGILFHQHKYLQACIYLGVISSGHHSTMLRVVVWILFGLASNRLWLLLRGIFCFGQNVLWRLNGTSSLIKNSFNESSYTGSVQVMNINFRYKSDMMGQASDPEIFIASHERFVDPEYVLENDHVSLFNVHKDKAIWVQVEKGVDISKSKYASFIYIAQYRLAKKLIIMPIHVFHKLGKKLGKPKAKLIILSNTARCGSTLLTRIFAETQTCLSYSEPFCLNAITLLRGVVSDQERAQIFTHCINLLCKPLQSRDIEAFVLKPTQPNMVEVPQIKKLFPKAYHIFLYREALAVAKSVAKCADGVANIAKLHILGRYSATTTKAVVESLGLHSENFGTKLTSDLHFGIILWAAAIRQYLDFREAGIDIVAARYEDMIKDPNYAFCKIFEYCDLPFDSRAVEVGMSQDSQRGSPISIKCLKNYKSDEFTGEVKIMADKVCDQFRVPRFGEAFIAPGTITTID